MPSELRVDNINSTSSPYDPVFSTTGGALSHRNLIINGAMQVSQRLANDTLIQVTNATYVSLDRWKTWENTDGTYQVKQKNITDLDGFTSSLYLSPNAEDTSIANSYYSLVGTIIEAQNLQHIGVGTANAKTMTLSFYIKSNLTGKMNAYLAKYDNGTMVVPLEFDLPSSAGTWERKTLTVPAVTTGGVINNDNGLGFEVIWALTVGSTYKIGTSGTWGSNGNGLSTSNHNINFMGSTSNYIELTGVQLELGTVATPFEHRSYADELIRCERYYQNSCAEGNVPSTSTSGKDTHLTTSWTDGNAPFPNPLRTRMRDDPTVVLRARGSTTTGQVSNGGTARTASVGDPGSAGISYIAVTSGTAGQYNAFSYELSAEL